MTSMTSTTSMTSMTSTTSMTSMTSTTSSSSSAVSKIIYLNASELAIAVGANPYQNIKDLIIKLWGRYFPEDYFSFLDEIKRTNKVEVIQETEYQCLQRLTAKYANDQIEAMAVENKIKDCLKSDDIADLQAKQQSVLQEMLVKKDISAEDKQALEKTLVSLTNKTFGTRKEGDAITQYENLTKKRVQRLSKYFTQKFPTHGLETEGFLGNVEWKLGGKIDGMTENGELIEVKNRMNRFFNQVRDYEKVQIQTYFQLLDIESGYLVESLVKKKGDAPEINIVAVQYEPEYWNNFIIPRTRKFIDYFQHILLDNQFKIRLLVNNEKEMEKEIRSNLFPITGKRK